MTTNEARRHEIQHLGCQVVWRSLFLETLWHFEKRQNVGFVFALMPAIRCLYPRHDEQQSVVLRHLELANTHPAMSPLAVGVTVRLEEELGPAVISYRNRMMEALAAIGDHVFWNHVRPLAAVVAACYGICCERSLVAAAALLVVYNIPHGLARILGFRLGFRLGLHVFSVLTMSRVEVGCRAVRRVLAVLLGIFAGKVLMTAIHYEGIRETTYLKLGVVACLVACGMIAYVLTKVHVSIGQLVYPVVGVGVVLFLLLGV